MTGRDPNVPAPGAVFAALMLFGAMIPVWPMIGAAGVLITLWVAVR